MPRTLTAWVKPTGLRNLPSADSIQIAIWDRSVGVKVMTIARSSAARDADDDMRTTAAIIKPQRRDIREGIIAANPVAPGSQILEICDGCAVRIGIDLGGTKIEGLALADDGRELARHRERTPAASDEVLPAIGAVVARLDADAGGTGTVGVGTPGVLHPSRRVI